MRRFINQKPLTLKIPDGPGSGPVDPIRVHVCVPTLRKCWARLDMNLGPIWVFSDSLHPKESKIIWTLTGSILELEICPWVQTEPQQEVGKKKHHVPTSKN